ncbi:hypothetical protein HPP92_020628 [Vanilla planifolia]|uniref:Uncharacterized protein n=1 Tax=Vanilla planifolia TaxID=51239 RepID=A0A835UIN9_VANPL|nr:hypothetical protein HPP92_020628 [Vanilla planifolia]
MRNKQERRKLRPSFALGKSERYSNTLNRASHLPILPPSLKRRSKRKRCGLKRALHTLPKLVGSHGKQLPPVFFSSWFPSVQGSWSSVLHPRCPRCRRFAGSFWPLLSARQCGERDSEIERKRWLREASAQLLFSNPKF